MKTKSDNNLFIILLRNNYLLLDRKNNKKTYRGACVFLAIVVVATLNADILAITGITFAVILLTVGCVRLLITKTINFNFGQGVLNRMQKYYSSVKDQFLINSQKL